MSVKVEIEFDYNILNKNLNKIFKSKEDKRNMDKLKSFIEKKKDYLKTGNWDTFWEDESNQIFMWLNSTTTTLQAVLVAILLKSNINFECPESISTGFFNFPGITSIKFKEGLKKISGLHTFPENLKRLYLPSTLKSIYRRNFGDAFGDLTNLNSIYYNGPVHDWKLLVYPDMNKDDLDALKKIKVFCNDGECNGLGEKL